MSYIMRKCFSSTSKTYTILLVLLIIYNEFLVYYLQSFTWTQLKCKNETNCLRILLVADPQLIGEENENYHFLTPVSIFDSDRYLQKTYSCATNFMEPDVIIFLGDLLDEGSVAKTAQYFRYLRRFFTIFSTGYPVKHIWLPGDNDVGGETDNVSEYKIRRFEQAFSQAQVIEVKNVKFTKVNRMLPQPEISETKNENSNQISVVVSHMPLILVPATFVDMVLEILKPKLIFAAHEHKSEIIEVDSLQQHRKIQEFNKQNKTFKYKLDYNSIIEILVPPASYRMGTKDVGYGGAIIDNDGTLQYVVFWSPNRFLHLRFYILFVSVLTIHVLFTFYRRQKTQKIHYKIIKSSV